MYGLLVAFAKWLEGTPWGVGVRNSLWAYPFTAIDPLHRAVHLDRDKSGLGFAAPRLREAARDSRAAPQRTYSPGTGSAFVSSSSEVFSCFPRPRLRSLSMSHFAGSWAFSSRWLYSGISSSSGRPATGEQRTTARQSRNYRVSPKSCCGCASSPRPSRFRITSST